MFLRPVNTYATRLSRALPVYLGIEIGGTKLQLGVGRADEAPLTERVRFDVDRTRGAEGICRQIQRAAPPLIGRHGVRAIGVGFGGPVNTKAGQIVTSSHIDGWDRFPLVRWARQQFDLPAVLANDTDAGGLAEARLGAGRGKEVVFYTNVGSGIGGALIIGGDIYCKGARISAELGQLRPGLQAEDPGQTIQSLASGWAIGDTAIAMLTNGEYVEPATRADLLKRCGGNPQQMTTARLAEAAADGNTCALAIFKRACQVFGWAIAQMITLLAPDVVVVGGGVSLCDETLYLDPLRREVDRYVFPPQLGHYEIVRATLGEEMVVYGALALAAELHESRDVDTRHHMDVARPHHKPKLHRSLAKD